MKHQIVLKPGTTGPDLLDTIDVAVVEYMRGKRGLDEKQMRNLLLADVTVCASYNRKIERSVWAAIGAGVPAKLFGKAA